MSLRHSSVDAARRIFFPALMLAAASCASVPTQHTLAPVATTQSGKVSGRIEGGVVEYLGIPYAAPPVSELRWRAPVSVAAWSDVRPATTFSPACPQVMMLAVFAGPTAMSEDCLYLNVIAPRSISKGAKLPVLFWVHGGGFVDGTAADYNARKLAERGNLIVVTINYRLSLLGIFAHPALAAESDAGANFTLLDQQFALHWVKDNIAAFGGDPGNITVAGQSAGSASAAYMIMSPRSRGLAQRAILQSSASFLSALPLEVAQRKAIAFAKAAGCGEGDDAEVAHCLRAMPVNNLMSLSSPVESFGPYVAVPVADGKTLLSGGASAISAGDFDNVPIMIGSTQDEGNFFTALPIFYSGEPITQTDVEGYVKAVYGGNAGPGGTLPAYPSGTPSSILAHYPSAAYPSAQLRMNAIQSDAFICRIQRGVDLLGARTKTYAYEFRDRTAPSLFPALPDFKPLAYHTSDLQYQFEGFHGGKNGVQHELNAAQKKLSDDIVKAWANFAHLGNPNGAGNAPWPVYKTSDPARSYLIQDLPGFRTISAGQQAMDHKCGFWNDLLAY